VTASVVGEMTECLRCANIFHMGKIDDIKTSLEQLSVAEQREMMEWFAELRERMFDEAIERDAKAGKLDWLMEEAMEEHRAGRTTPL
jgi:hypothetical protein